jgi:hypothetical protein
MLINKPGMLLLTLTTVVMPQFSNASTCVAGRYYPSTGVSTYVCKKCPAGKYGDRAGFDSEAAACPSSCPPGTYGTAMGSTSEAAACPQTCPVGKYGNIPGGTSINTACPKQCDKEEAAIPAKRIKKPPTHVLDACCPLQLTFESDNNKDHVCKHADKAFCTQLGLALFTQTHPGVEHLCKEDCKRMREFKYVMQSIVTFNTIDFIIVIVSFCMVWQHVLMPTMCPKMRDTFWRLYPISIFVLLLISDFVFQIIFIIRADGAQKTLVQMQDSYCTWNGAGLRDQIIRAENQLVSCVYLGIAELILGVLELVLACYNDCNNKEGSELKWEATIYLLNAILAFIDMEQSRSAQDGTSQFLDTPFELSQQASARPTVSDDVHAGEWCMKISNITESCLKLIPTEEVALGLPTDTEIIIFCIILGGCCVIIWLCQCFGCR